MATTVEWDGGVAGGGGGGGAAVTSTRNRWTFSGQQRNEN